MIIILNETTVAVEPCPSSMIYTAKSWTRATTTVAWFMRCSFRTRFKGAGWSTAMYIVQIALVCWNGGHRVSCILGTRVAAKHCVRCRPWLQSLAAYCRHSFCMCNAQLGSTHNAVHSLGLFRLHYITRVFCNLHCIPRHTQCELPLGGHVHGMSVKMWVCIFVCWFSKF